jgi:hypothetical protein
MINPLKPPEQLNGTTWVGYHNYANWFRETSSRETKNEHPTSRMKFLSNVARAKSYAWWNWADPMPFLGSGLLAARRVAGKLLRRLRLR